MIVYEMATLYKFPAWPVVTQLRMLLWTTIFESVMYAPILLCSYLRFINLIYKLFTLPYVIDDRICGTIIHLTSDVLTESMKTKLL